MDIQLTIGEAFTITFFTFWFIQGVIRGSGAYGAVIDSRVNTTS